MEPGDGEKMADPGPSIGILKLTGDAAAFAREKCLENFTGGAANRLIDETSP
jgi:hypothetical protein